MQAILGIVAILVIAWSLSEHRRHVDYRVIGIGLAFQFALAILFIQVQWVTELLLTLSYFVTAIETATLAGTSFLFGFLGGGESPYILSGTGATYLFAFRVLPQVVVFSAIIAVLWYWRIIPGIVRVFSWILKSHWVSAAY